jgi:hypothetical protein
MMPREMIFNSDPMVSFAKSDKARPLRENYSRVADQDVKEKAGDMVH